MCTVEAILSGLLTAILFIAWRLARKEVNFLKEVNQVQANILRGRSD
jgi:hypothetical protein